MANLVASIFQKTKAIVESTTKALSTWEQVSRTIASEIIQTGKIKAEYVTGAFTTAYEQVYQEGVSLLELIQSLFSKTVEDQASVSEYDEIALVKPVEDSTGFNDSFDRTVQFTRNVTDDLNVTDDVNGAAVDDDQVATVFKVTGDQVELGESDQVSLGKSTSDQFNLSDSISTAMGFSRSIDTDQFNLSDSDDVAFNKVPTDSLNISNPGTILNQDYGSDYFFEDYVGISRTIA